MIDILLSNIDPKLPKEVQIHQLREQLQHLVLKIMSDQKAFVNVAFLGGTALRICHHLQRYSEDLDFSVIQKNGYDFLKLVKNIVRELENYGLEIDIKYKQGVIDNAYIRFPNILQKMGLSNISTQKLSIKIEIDTNPLHGYQTEKMVLNNIFMYPIVLFDLSSLFAGKIHAILHRKFIKGRDWFDLVWYLTNNVSPNIDLLQNAEKQSGVSTIVKNEKEVYDKIYSKVKKITTKQILDDVGTFLINKNQKELLKIEYIIQLLEKKKIVDTKTYT